MGQHYSPRHRVEISALAKSCALDAALTPNSAGIERLKLFARARLERARLERAALATPQRRPRQSECLYGQGGYSAWSAREDCKRHAVSTDFPDLGRPYRVAWRVFASCPNGAVMDSFALHNRRRAVLALGSGRGGYR